MAENIELHSFCTNATNRDSDPEEYHQIPETTFSPKCTTKTFYDFFTQYEVKTVGKGSAKKKKSKKQERTPNLMDLISSELSSVVVPIRENVITMVDTREQNSYLESTPRALKIFQRKPSHYDSELG